MAKQMAVLTEKDLQQVTSRQKVAKIVSQIFLYLFLCTMALIIVFPFYWMIISSVKSLAEYRLSVPTLFPREIIWSNYLQAFTKAELGKPFPQEAELKQKAARLAELNIALNIDDKTPLEAMAEEAPPRNEVAKSARPSVLQKLHSYEAPTKTEVKKSKEEVR